MPRPDLFHLFFLARAIFPAGIFFNFSESAQTSSHIALLRKAPLLAIDPVAARGGTSAAQQGISSWKIRQQTGHASDAMMARYIRDGELFTDNAAGALL
jgi:hypothetical protein